LSSQIAVLADKHVIAVGKPEQVIALSHPFIQHFFLGERGRRALEGAMENSRSKESEHGK
jgi:phospholipid/cholesterol/gamma-HCH transport system ATP-binding protein